MAWYSYNNWVGHQAVETAAAEPTLTVLSVVFSLPLAWLVFGVPHPAYPAWNIQTIGIHILVSAGFGAIFIFNGLLFGLVADKLLLRTSILRSARVLKGRNGEQVGAANPATRRESELEGE